MNFSILYLFGKSISELGPSKGCCPMVSLYLSSCYSETLLLSHLYIILPSLKFNLQGMSSQCNLTIWDLLEYDHISSNQTSLWESMVGIDNFRYSVTGLECAFVVFTNRQIVLFFPNVLINNLRNRSCIAISVNSERTYSFSPIRILRFTSCLKKL